MGEPITDAEVVGEEVPPVLETTPALPSSALAIRPGSTDLIHAGSPAERVAKATAIATELDAIIKAQGMRTKIGRQKVVKADGTEVWEDKYHVNVEAWQTLSTFLRVAIVPQEPEPVKADDGTVKLAEYEVCREFYPKGTRGKAIREGTAVPERVERAKVQGPEGFTCRTLILKDGVVVGAGSSRCTRLEESWRDSPDYALEGMAQTRSQGRAMGAVARWIVALAGYSGTPAEEMPPTAEPPEPAAEQPLYGPVVGEQQLASMRKALGYLLDCEPDANAVGLVLNTIQEKAGYLPHFPLAMIVLVAQTVKDRMTAREETVPAGEGDPVQETAEERAERENAERIVAETEAGQQ